MNRYSKALKQLKSTKIDSKIKKLEEAPTNNTKGVYSLNPQGYRLGKPEPPTQFYPKADGTWPDGVPGTDGELVYTRPGGFWDGGKTWEGTVEFEPAQDNIGDDGKNTDGLIASDGTVKTFLPDGSRGFVLGPLTDGFVLDHTTDAYTNIGYLQKDTREFVLLGRISGQWESGFYSNSGDVPVWDGTATGFTAHNENFTLAMAQWMRTEILADRYYTNLPYFYSGGVPQGGITDCPSCPGGMKGGTLVGGGGDGSSLSGNDKQVGKMGIGSGDDVTTGDQYTQDDPNHGDSGDAGLWGQIKDKLGGIWDKFKGGLEDLGDALNDLFDDPFQGAQDLIDSLEDVLDDWSGQPKDDTTVNTGGGQTDGGQTGEDTGGNVETPKDDKPKDDKPKDDKPKDDKPKDEPKDKPKDKPKDDGDLSDVLTPGGGSLSKDDIKKAKDQVGNWFNDLKDWAKGAGDVAKLVGSGFEAIPTSADALQQYLDNNDPKSPHYRKNDPRSDNYEGPYEPPTDAKWKNEVGQQIKDSLPKTDWEKRAKNSPDGKTQLTNLEITTLSNRMKPLSGNGDMRFHTLLNSLPVSGDQNSDDIPGKDAITTVTIDKDGNIDIVTNYRFSDRDDVSSGGPLMKMYVQKYMDIDKGDEGTFPFFDKDARYDNRTQTGTTHDINMRLRLNINGRNSSTWGARAKDVKNFKNSMSNFSLGSMYNSYYPQGKLISESRGLRKVKFVMKEIADAPVSAAPTNTQTTSQQPTQKTQSKQTADAVAKEYLEKNGPKKTQELLDKTKKVKDKLAFGIFGGGDGGGLKVNTYQSQQYNWYKLTGGEEYLNDRDGTKFSPEMLEKLEQEWQEKHGNQSSAGGGDTKIAAGTPYNRLDPWSQDLLQRGLKGMPAGSMWEDELRRLQRMYPGFYPRVQLDDPQYQKPGSNYVENLPSWFSFGGFGRATWSMYQGKPVVWGTNYSGGQGYITPAKYSNNPGTPESGYGTRGYDPKTNSGGTSWKFVLHKPKAKPETSPMPKDDDVKIASDTDDDGYYYNKFGEKVPKPKFNPGDDIAFNWGNKDKKPPEPPTKKTQKGALDATKASTGMYDNMTPEIFQQKYGMSWSDYMNLPQASINKTGGTSIASATGASATDAAILAGRRRRKKTGLAASYQPGRSEITGYVSKKLQESDLNFTKRQKRLIREVRNEYKVPELPKKYKMNFKGKFTPQNTPDKTASKESDGLAAVANMRGQKWSQDDKYWAGYETTETMNVVYDKVGHGEQAWNRMIEGARQKNGWKNREIIEQLNIIAHEKASRKVNPDYQSPWVIQEASPEQIEKEKNFDKVNKLKQIVGNTKRGDIQPEYPDQPAVELGPDGYHPNYGKKYKHDKLDPHSAEAMPDTGNPEIDANIKKATDHKKKARKLKNLLGKMRR